MATRPLPSLVGEDQRGWMRRLLSRPAGQVVFVVRLASARRIPG